ncbi:nitrate ABC transporter, permease protein [Caldalkalibacillus thermarum]|uniref:nitrate ABC transporter permease n=1 Tax=Caldalkalibacillus thermarum TaxID=296745 RepID=UPI0016686BEC|nr:nitrate ABC transporter permease [Caldalkalibacillus thermarum]GGK30980.1 nitrate ABC transporter, permease protein [Caldalkalibacillus thermarum]
MQVSTAKKEKFGLTSKNNRSPKALLLSALKADRTKSWLLFLIICTCGLAVWELGVRLEWFSPMVPAVGTVMLHLWDQLSNPFYYYGVNDVGLGWQLLASLERVLLGFFLASLVAVPLGFMIGLSPVLARAVDPFIQVLKPVSPLAWLPIGLALLQDSERTAIFIIFISSLWPLLINTIFGVRQIPEIYLQVARLLEVSRLRLVRHILWPAALPQIVNGLRVSLGIAWMVIIAAEMLIGGRGIGYFVWNEWNNLNVANIMVAILFIGLIGIALDRLLAWVERRVRYVE